jgi:hypothetical protein
MQEEAIKANGGCLCGKVRYEAEVFIKSGYYCHCAICQQASGHAGEVGVPVKIGSLVFTDGEPTYYTSSEFGKRGFCAHCGTKLIWRASNEELDWATNVNAGSLDNRRDVQLTRHIYVDTQMPWNQMSDDLPRFAESDMEAVMEMWMKERGAEPLRSK